MHFTNIRLTNFRCYQHAAIPLQAGLTIVHGANGSGKSNLLEAAYLLAIGKSYRTSSERDLVAWGELDQGGYGLIDASVARAGNLVELRLGLDINPIGGAMRKRIRVNGIQRRVSDLIGVLTAVLFTATDIDLIFGSPSGRRRYLDILLSQTSAHYMQALVRYQRVLAQRNAVLRSFREGRAQEGELTYWDDALCAEGVTILTSRREATDRLTPLIKLAFNNIGIDDNLDVSYVSSVAFTGPPNATEMHASLEASRSAERKAAITLIGPHRDDLKISMNGVEMARHASRGQARLAALSMRIAEANFHEALGGDAPVVLLDDVLSELDVRRREVVLEQVVSDYQVILTTPDMEQVPTNFQRIADKLRVESGVIVADSTTGA